MRFSTSNILLILLFMGLQFTSVAQQDDDVQTYDPTMWSNSDPGNEVNSTTSGSSSAGESFGNPGGGTSSDPDTNINPTWPLPFDGGASVLLIAGAAYGWMRRNNRLKTQSIQQ